MIAVLLHKANVRLRAAWLVAEIFHARAEEGDRRRLQDRIMFGWDWPTLTLERLVEDWRSLGYPEEVYEKIFHRNAEAFFPGAAPTVDDSRLKHMETLMATDAVRPRTDALQRPPPAATRIAAEDFTALVARYVPSRRPAPPRDADDRRRGRGLRHSCTARTRTARCRCRFTSPACSTARSRARRTSRPPTTCRAAWSWMPTTRSALSPAATRSMPRSISPRHTALALSPCATAAISAAPAITPTAPRSRA